jgi:hypothetical protein
MMSKSDKVLLWIMNSTGVMSGENNNSTTSSTTGASTTTFITNNNNNIMGMIGPRDESVNLCEFVQQF